MSLPGTGSAASFYDDFAADYHLIFADWDATIGKQATVITGLLRDLGVSSGRVLDATCGIGTQAIGLAQAGYAVTATDISPVSVERCARESARRGLDIVTGVADLRTLDHDVTGPFDAVVSFDNALPHLLQDTALDAACRAMRTVLRPGGTLLASIRDYDAILAVRPGGDPPRRSADSSGERIVFQVWEWTAPDRYTLRHFIMTSETATSETATGDTMSSDTATAEPAHWNVTERRTEYRALTREALSAALARAGFGDITWLMPAQSGYYQPIVSATSRTIPATTPSTP